MQSINQVFMNTQKTEAIILAILSLSRSEGRTRILRTVLMKFIYLLDVYCAETNPGKETFTNLEWKFYHYGPFSSEAAEIIDSLAKQGMLSEETIEAEFRNDKEYKLYSIPDYSSPKNLSELGVPSRAKLNLSADMKRHDTLSSLLDYVYFKTAPMINAKPGDILSFQNCEKLNISDFKPLEMKPLNKKKLAENKRKLRELIAQRKAYSQIKFSGAYDEIYEKSMAALDDEPLAIGIKGKASLNIK